MDYNEDMDLPVRKDPTPTWIKNEHGIKSCWPNHVAVKLVRENYGWSFTDADEVPSQKQYPLGMGEFTEAGLKRRMAAQESQRAFGESSDEDKAQELDKLSLDDLRTRGKRAGIDRYWVKSQARLLKELKEKKS
jgi:hypothetical protein